MLTICKIYIILILVSHTHARRKIKNKNQPWISYWNYSCVSLGFWIQLRSGGSWKRGFGGVFLFFSFQKGLYLQMVGLPHLTFFQQSKAIILSCKFLFLLQLSLIRFGKQTHVQVGHGARLNRTCNNRRPVPSRLNPTPAAVQIPVRSRCFSLIMIKKA